MTKTALLIAIEGIDGAGTTTQSRLLVDWMNANGLPAYLTCEPSQGPIGLLLRQILSHQMRPLDSASLALLFAADRTDHLQNEIAPQLAQGNHVITDRYVYSSLAYQSLDQDLGWLAEINRMAPEPALTVYLRTDPDMARERLKARKSQRDLFEVLELQRRIAMNYDAILGSSMTDGAWVLDPAGSRWSHRPPLIPEKKMVHRRLLPDLERQPQCAILDGSLSVETLHEQLRELIAKVDLQSNS